MVVISEKDVCLGNMETIFSDLNTFEKVSIKKVILDFQLIIKKISTKI